MECTINGDNMLEIRTMPDRYVDALLRAVAMIGVLSLASLPAAAQAPTYRAPRTADGKPNLNGIWQAINSADWDLEGHAAAKGPVPSLGAVFARPADLGVVEGDAIPSAYS
jgi:hypothetical protein